MDFVTLKTELAARGFDYLSTTRQGYFINRAYQEICGARDYPFLESSTATMAPISITDLRTVESVVDTTTKVRLAPLDRRHILEDDYQLSTTGSPLYYYITSGNTLNVYPANTTDTISVRYWKVPTELSLDADTPVIPTRWQHLIVDGAVVFAYFDSDNFEAATGMLDFWNRGRQAMDDELLSQQHDQPDDRIVAVTDHQDGSAW